MTCSYIGWPSKGVFVDYLALWVTLLAISSAALLFLAGWKAMNMYKERAAADQSSICASSITKRTCVSERGSVNENKQGGASTAAAAAAAVKAANAKAAAAAASSTKTPAPSTISTTSNAAPKANTAATPQPDASTESEKATSAAKKEDEEEEEVEKRTPANNNTDAHGKTENEQPAIELKVREKNGSEETEEEDEKKNSEGEDGVTSSNDIANTQV